MSLSAQVFDTVASSPWVLQVLITSFLPSTPPLALIFVTSRFAAASAGPSNGAIGPLFEPSYAQPMMTCLLAADCVCAAAVATTTSAATATTTSAQRARFLPIMVLLSRFGPLQRPACRAQPCRASCG